MPFWAHLKLLLWKNFLIQKRKICVTVMEILFPLCFALLIMGTRSAPRMEKEQVTYQDVPILSRYYGYGSMDFTETFGYTPNYPCLEKVIKILADGFVEYNMKINRTIVKPFSSEKEMLDYIKQNPSEIRYAIVFSGITDPNVLPDKLTYFIRPRSTMSWITNEVLPFQTGAPNDDIGVPDYYRTGIVLIQTLIGKAVIEGWTRRNLTNVIFERKQMPYPRHVQDPLPGMMRSALPVFIVLSFMTSVVTNTKYIVVEKEKKLKRRATMGHNLLPIGKSESMKLMGLTMPVYWASWFITFMVYLTIIISMYIFFLARSTANGPVLGNNDVSLVFFLFFMYAVSLVSFCFMISTFTQKANSAAVVSALAYFLSLFPYFYYQSVYGSLSYTFKMMLGLLFNSAMALGIYVLTLYMSTGEPLTWSKINSPVHISDNFSMLDAIIMLFVDTIIHLLITWYVDNIYPGEFGVGKPLNFPFTKSYWNVEPAPAVAQPGVDSKYFEREPSSLKVGISIKGLRKEFGGRVAVSNVSLNMYEGQITVLLGHNGAGKSTTMFMLTGFITPSSGTAIVNGYDICTSIDKVREGLGLCPQHDILFDTMTVNEHLMFFALLKGCPSSELQKEVESMAAEVGIKEKANAFSATLSGGQKRKLSVGIALIHHSRVVILDEASTGMDPSARRQIWDVLQRHREGRTILLTTHFMDEADFLGDRIAIMAEGVVKCCGSSLFLKKLYGTGYHLTLVKSGYCKLAAVEETIKKFIPSAIFESEINTELSFMLPDDQSSQFPNLFRELESRKRELGIGGFGTTATTMEEVFLNVGKDTSVEPEHGAQDHLVLEANISSFNSGYTKTSGSALFLSRFRAMMMKKMLCVLRNKGSSLLQLFLSAFITMIILLPGGEQAADVEFPLVFDVNAYGSTYIPYASDRNRLTQDYKDKYPTLFDKTQKLEPIDVCPTSPCWQSMDAYILNRAEQLTLPTFSKEMAIGVEFLQGTTGNITIARAYYSSQLFHTMTISVAAMLNTVARVVAGPQKTLTSGLRPLPLEDTKDKSVATSDNYILGFIYQFIFLLGLSFLTSRFVFYVVQERTVGSKHLQLVSGVGHGIYWASHFIWDYFNYLIGCVIILLVFVTSQSPEFAQDGQIFVTACIYVLYGWATIPFMYVLSFLFESAPSAYANTILINIFSGFFTNIVISTIPFFVPKYKELGEVAHYIFLFTIPNHCFGDAIINMYDNYSKRQQCIKMFNYTYSCLVKSGECCKGIGKGCEGENCIKFFDNILLNWDAPGIGKNLTAFVFQGFAYLLILVWIEMQLTQVLLYTLQSEKNPSLSQKPDSKPEDSDVLAERIRINSIPPSQLRQQKGLLLVNLYKVYGNFVAVNRLCVGVPEKECFGLLGTNGAGKTTVFKMLTGSVALSGGNAYVNEYDIKHQMHEVQANMGYCPQFDALLDHLTARETLTVYAGLRGIPKENTAYVVNSLIDLLTLRPHADKPSGQYSGGNKRKLSTAIALVGDPAFILLDEPSSGMDPASRRQLWNVLSAVRSSSRTLVLTSHSMEECEALCTRIAIQVKGQFVCLGSTQHLKSKFGQGYSLIAKMDESDTNVKTVQDAFIAYVKATFPDATVFDEHEGYVHMQVPNPHVHLADVFTLMERAKAQMAVKDYSIHQTTLEQVFLAFSNAPAAPVESKPKRMCDFLFVCCQN